MSKVYDNQNFIAAQEHNETYRAKKVISYANDGSDTLVVPESPVMATRIAVDSGDANIQYIGKAKVGTATSAASWQIRELNETSGTVITYADGDAAFDNVWDNRESLTYS